MFSKGSQKYRNGEFRESTLFPLTDTLSVEKFIFEDFKACCHYLKRYLPYYVHTVEIWRCVNKLSVWPSTGEWVKKCEIKKKCEIQIQWNIIQP